MGVSESWAHDRVSLPGYDLYRCDRPSGHRGAGVLLYVKSSLSSVQFVTRANFPEQAWCKLIVEGGSELLVGVCYRSPTNYISDDSHEVLRKVIKEVSDRNIILMGDFNYPDIILRIDRHSSEQLGYI